MSKKKLIAGNWKMNGSIAANDALVRAVIAGMGQAGCTVAVCVPAPYLAQLQVLRHGSALELGAQDVSRHEQGAYTGEVSAAMLREFVGTALLGRIASALDPVEPLRLQVAASQMVGVVILRHVVRIEPLASASEDDVVALVAPTIQRYLAPPEG